MNSETESNGGIQFLHESCIYNSFFQVARRIETTVVGIYIKHNSSIQDWRNSSRKRGELAWRNHNAMIEVLERRTNGSFFGGCVGCFVGGCIINGFVGDSVGSFV